jgi:hypothetical protein
VSKLGIQKKMKEEAIQLDNLDLSQGHLELVGLTVMAWNALSISVQTERPWVTLYVYQKALQATSSKKYLPSSNNVTSAMNLNIMANIAFMGFFSEILLGRYTCIIWRAGSSPWANETFSYEENAQDDITFEHFSTDISCALIGQPSHHESMV